ncbi:MAG: hypothetical protein MO846_06655 [Candidatus Devosia symbiotica]|nr:hypothetical protein [Candidatus Devosia symbiotica]
MADPLPAEFEIENPDLSAGDGFADFSWLTLDSASHAPWVRPLAMYGFTLFVPACADTIRRPGCSALRRSHRRQAQARTNRPPRLSHADCSSG